MFKHDKIDVIVQEMRNLGEQFVPYSTPQNENDISILKTRQVTIEGYDLVLYYTKSKFEEHGTEVLQIYGQRMPFLPFYLIFKLARLFLGDLQLSLVELYKENRKIYCWTVNKDLEGNFIPLPDGFAEECVYEGSKYYYLQPHQVSFY
jgi:hypothetical protein